MRLLAPQTVARRINRSVTRVAQLDRSGDLPAMRDSIGRRFYLEEDVERYVSQNGRDRRVRKA